MAIRKITDVELAGKRVLIRADLNVPVQGGRVEADQRIRASLPTVRHALAQGARVMLMSHLGRPQEGAYSEESSLAPVAEALSALLGRPVPLVQDYLERPPVLADGDLVLLENVRFNKGEKKDDAALAQRYARLCDVYVMDAFGTAHRAEASTHGVGLQVPVACAGLLLARELEALGKALAQPQRPLVAIVAGSKVSTKLTVLENLTRVVDQLIVGGGIANTFIAAAGFGVGRSLLEPDLVDTARRLIEAARARNADIPIPGDVVVGSELSESARAVVKPVHAIGEDDLILDIGPGTARRFSDMLTRAGTIVWNGPVGVFEIDQFGQGTRTLARAIADSGAFSIAGGGDTLAAIAKYGVAERISYISTGGGAFLEFLEGRKLPAVAMLEARAAG